MKTPDNYHISTAASRGRIALASAAVCLFVYVAAQPPTQKPNFKKGILHGRILDSAGKPVADATVALKGSDGKVLAWSKTDAKGDYSLAADPKQALKLRPSKSRGLLEICIRTAGDIAMAPVKAVVSAVANPGTTIKSTAASIATGTPAPLAAQAITAGLPNKHNAPQVIQSAGNTAVTTAANAPGNQPAAPTPTKGQATIVVNATGFKDATVTPNAYWLDGPKLDSGSQTGMGAWLETVKMAPTAAKEESVVVPEAVTLAEGSATPSLVPPGSSVKVSVKLVSPPGPEHKVRVFARESWHNAVVELKPGQGANKDVYAGEMPFDAKAPPGDKVITVGALRAEPVEIRLNPKKPDPLAAFVSRVDLMRADKTYEYDPLIMAAQNRIDLKITVLPK